MSPSISPDLFVKTVNGIRRGSKGTWYQWTGLVDGKSVQLKGHGTWLQVFRIDGVSYGGLHDQKVVDFKRTLLEAVT